MSETTETYNYRFLGLESLYGEGSLSKLSQAHILIIGIGGIGSWIAENLARSAVGKITLVDLDDICFSNINRQIHALGSSAGQMKTDVMKKRILDINPKCEVECLNIFYSEKSSDQILALKPDYIVDAFDKARLKAHLASECIKKNQRLIVTGGAAAKTQPQMVKIDDLAFTINDPLLALMRRDLKNNHQLLKTYKQGRQKKKVYIPCVYSPEVIKTPTAHTAQVNQGGCHGQGSASFVTSQFANLTSAYIVNEILGRDQIRYER